MKDVYSGSRSAGPRQVRAPRLRLADALGIARSGLPSVRNLTESFIILFPLPSCHGVGGPSVSGWRLLLFVGIGIAGRTSSRDSSPVDILGRFKSLL